MKRNLETAQAELSDYRTDEEEEVNEPPQKKIKLTLGSAKVNGINETLQELVKVLKDMNASVSSIAANI